MLKSFHFYGFVCIKNMQALLVEETLRQAAAPYSLTLLFTVLHTLLLGLVFAPIFRKFLLLFQHEWSFLSALISGDYELQSLNMIA